MSLAGLGKSLFSLPSHYRTISTRTALLGLEDFFEKPLKEGETRTAGKLASTILAEAQHDTVSNAATSWHKQTKATQLHPAV